MVCMRRIVAADNNVCDAQCLMGLAQVGAWDALTLR